MIRGGSPGQGTRTILEEAAAVNGIDSVRAELLRAGSNSIYLVDELVGRVGKVGSVESATRELRISQWLNASGLPTVRVAEVAHPITVIEERPVTWWERIPAHRAATTTELAAVLRRLHALAPPTVFTLPQHDPLAGLHGAITDAAALGDNDREWLIEHLDTLSSRYRALAEPVQRRVIHGDAWQGNVVVPHDGIPIVVDLERVSLGRPAWDLIQVAADRTDFDRLSEGDYRSFVDTYGADVTTDPAFRLLADLQELRWVVFALSQSSSSDNAAYQVRHRLACLRGDIARPWHWDAL
ncbi:phosphotransferase family protein [Nocardia thailandica]|uniref:phosphotransferase family protein n=1 Tax=Nocardia thailandica TaxID=257275 RepID=UPI001FE04472|nr:aminoglycoside phosphotransferase family protein [Nocardia thailandica]